jgi:hypothetical protein
MSRRTALSFVLFAAAAVGLLGESAPVAVAQNVVPTDESFESADGVKLYGRFYKAAVTKNGSCVLILPQFKKDPTKGDWDGLAKRLANEGYNVLILHYRGHGKSTDIIAKDFFGNPVLGQINAMLVPGANKTPPKSTLSMNELKPAYMPMLVNDVMAARSFLERKNDAGEVNVSTMYLIGAGEGCPLGMLYTATEWHREEKVPNIAVPPQFVSSNRGLFPGGSPVGKDIAAAVWLSPDKTPSMSDGTVKSFISSYAPDMREETRMLFLYGEKDDNGKKHCKYYHDEVLVAKGKKGKIEGMVLTEVRPVKGAKELKGVDLLGNNATFGTEDTISKYLKAVEDDRKGKARFNRNYTAPLPVALATFGINPTK